MHYSLQDLLIDLPQERGLTFIDLYYYTVTSVYEAQNVRFMRGLT